MYLDFHCINVLKSHMGGPDPENSVRGVGGGGGGGLTFSLVVFHRRLYETPSSLYQYY